MPSRWTIDSYRVRTWTYHVLPNVGARVHYISDGFESRVKCIHWDHICMADGTAFRRRLEPSRLLRWAKTHLNSRTHSARTLTTSSTHSTSAGRRLTPATPYVAVVNLQL